MIVVAAMIDFATQADRDQAVLETGRRYRWVEGEQPQPL